MVATPFGRVSPGAEGAFDVVWDAIAPFHPGLAIAAGVVGVLVALLLTAVPVAGRWRSDGGGLVIAGLAALAMMAERDAIGPAVAVVAGIVLAFAWAAGRVPDRPVVAWMGGISLVGVWAAVPDTEPALIGAAVIGVPLVLGCLSGVCRGDRLAAVALVVVTAWVGSAGRVEVIGGMACVAMLVAPLPSATPGDRRFLQVIAIHSALVVIASRVVTRLGWTGSAIAAALLIAASVAAGTQARSRAVSDRGRVPGSR